MVKLEIIENIIKVSVPFSYKFINRAKKLGGKFNYSTTSWDFDLDEKNEVTELLNEIYMENGIDEVRRATVYLNCNHPQILECSTEDYFGINGIAIAERKGRDSAVRLGDNIIVAKGRFSSAAGSSKNPRLGDLEDITLKIKNISLDLANLILEKYGEEFVTLEVKEVKEVKEDTENEIKLIINKKIKDKLEALIKEGRTRKSISLSKEEMVYICNNLQ